MKKMLRSVIGAALVASGCARGGLPPSPPAFQGNGTFGAAVRSHASARPATSGYRTIYAFAGGSDGAQPEAGLLAVNGVLVGTTSAGGGASSCDGGCGTVYRVHASGTEHVLHRFAGGSDGENPAGGVVAIDGVFYGATVNGGASRSGTVFAVNPSGSERVLYAFAGAPDGAKPEATLLAYHGALYGTTYGGGNGGCFGSPSGCGTAFRVDVSGNETVLHRFGLRPDGALPISNLIVRNGTFYGTTTKRTTNEGGGVCGAGAGCGVVFAMTLTGGDEHVVYRFLRSPDASTPETGLVFADGLFYGTTPYGGTKGKGTVYLVNTLGGEQVVHSFNGFGDGANPFGGLLAHDGSLYGTTYNGGRHGKGTVFKIDASNVKTVLHDFAGGSDGANPLGTLALLDGQLYGTTKYGGANGAGTVFGIAP